MHQLPHNDRIEEYQRTAPAVHYFGLKRQAEGSERIDGILPENSVCVISQHPLY